MREGCLKGEMNQSVCLNPKCLTINDYTHNFCHQCRLPLVLKTRYRALKILGQGGFGRTFLAIDEDRPSKPYCVIKQFLPQAQGTASVSKAAKMFEEEAIRLDELGENHDQIPSLLAHFTVDDRQYLIQEFIDGSNLLDELKLGVFSQDKVKQVLFDLLNVLKFVHSRKVIHRDIKPANIILRQSDRKLVLVDFGAAKQVFNSQLSMTGTAIGSAAYSAPEQWRGKPKYASDLYSLGVTCVELLTNVSPTKLFDIDEGDWIWRKFLKNNPVDQKLAAVLDKLIQPAMKRRYESVDEVLSDFEEFQLHPKLTTETSIVDIPETYIPTKKNQVVKSQPTELQLTEEFPTPEKPEQSTFGQPVRPVTAKKSISGSASIVGLPKTVTEDLGAGIRLEMIAVPIGSFRNESGETIEIRKPFYMGKYPITQSQWQALMNTNLWQEIVGRTSNPSRFKGKDYPVERVSWHDCQEFIQKLNRKTGRNYRLPTEAEWEYGCRAVTSEQSPITDYCFGDDDDKLGIYAWYKLNADGQTHPVGQKQPNKFGLYDMHGNVWEWCEDDQAVQSQTTQSQQSLRRRSSTQKYLRGGSWFNEPRDCRSAAHFEQSPMSHLNTVGFRVICTLQGL